MQNEWRAVPGPSKDINLKKKVPGWNKVIVFHTISVDDCKHYSPLAVRDGVYCRQAYTHVCG